MTSDTYTAGIVLQPRFSFTADYYKIKIADYISTVGITNLSRDCYGDAGNTFVSYNTSYCASLPRDTIGRRFFVNTNVKF